MSRDTSALGTYITGLIEQTRACGYIYKFEAYVLEQLNRFCIEHHYDSATITRDQVMQWAIQRLT